MAGRYAIGTRPELSDLAGRARYTDGEARRIAAVLRTIKAP